MKTQFIYYSEETKFRIISTVLIAAIIAMVVFTGFNYDRAAGPVDPDNGKMANYPIGEEFYSENRASSDRYYSAYALANEPILDAEKKQIIFGE